MQCDFSIKKLITVTDNYSWDDGFPQLDDPNNSVQVEVQTPSNGSTGVFYGKAPFVYVELSSNVVDLTLQQTDQQTDYVWLEWDFGDHYNNTDRPLVLPLSSFNPEHLFIMPGKYNITLKYIKESFFNLDWFADVFFPQKHCAIWKWELLRDPRNITSTDLLCADYNKPIMWKDTHKGEKYEKIWLEEPCNKPCVHPTTYVSMNSSASVEKRKTDLTIIVEEIPPFAFLSAVPISSSPTDSSQTVRLSPCLSRAGSFPVEKVIWDFGNGEKPITISRRGIEVSDKMPSENSFYFEKNENHLSADPYDPRKFDAIVTYTSSIFTSHTFYPSISVVSANTATFDCASTIVGPIFYGQHSSARPYEVIDIDLSKDDKVVLALQCENDLVITKEPD